MSSWCPLCRITVRDRWICSRRFSWNSCPALSSSSCVFRSVRRRVVQTVSSTTAPECGGTLQSGAITFPFPRSKTCPQSSSASYWRLSSASCTDFWPAPPSSPSNRWLVSGALEIGRVHVESLEASLDAICSSTLVVLLGSHMLVNAVCYHSQAWM